MFNNYELASLHPQEVVNSISFISAHNSWGNSHLNEIYTYVTFSPIN